MEIHPSALKHRVSRESIVHAVENAMTSSDLGDNPLRVLILGADLAGNLLEIVAIVRTEDLLVIHAIPMRAKYRGFLPPP